MTNSGSALSQEYFKAASGKDFEALSPEGRINKILSIRTPNDVRFLSQFMEKDVSLKEFKQTSPKTSTAVFRFRVERFYCNASGNLHGGAQATIYDVLTSLAVQAIGTRTFWLNAGVSRNLEVTFLRPAPLGTILLCDVELMHTGKSLAFMRGVIKREDNGAIISVGKHDKAVVAVKEGWDAPAKSKL